MSRLTAHLSAGAALRFNAGMAIADFHALCLGLRAGLGGQAGSQPAHAADGPHPALHLDIAGVEITITDASHGGGSPAARIDVDFGEVPAGRQDDLLAALMDANLRMMGACAPAFARSPQGRIQLLAHWPLGPLELADAQDTLMALAAHALDWRRDAARQSGAPPGGFA